MTLLLLGGSGEAPQMARALDARGMDCAVWLPQGRRIAQLWPQRKAAADLVQSLNNPSIRAVLDASHPFDRDITDTAARHCAQRGIAYCLLWRPEWRQQPGDKWTRLQTEAQAPDHTPPGATVFLATGREGLAHFAQKRDIYIYCRQIGAPDEVYPWTNGEFVVQQPPFTTQQEISLFQRLGIDWLVLRNTGSTRADTKLAATRHLGLNVLMIDRPAPPDAPRVSTVDAALNWAAAL